MTTYIAKASLKINGTPATDDLMEDILQIAVEESLHLPSMCTLVIKNDKLAGRPSDTFWKHQDLFAMGHSLEVSFTSSTTESSEYSTASTGQVFKGEITAIESHFTAGSSAPIVVRAYDVAHRLHMGRYIRSFLNMTDSDVVNQIISEAGITAGTITDTTPVHQYIFQENQTNMEFLRERAARNGFELYVQNGQLNFCPPTSSGSVTLEWLTNLYSFRVRVSASEQVSQVEVRGWDYHTGKMAIVSTKTSGTVLTSNEHGTGVSKATAFSGLPKMIVVDQPVWGSAESDKIAQSLMNELSGEYIQADGRATGNPDIRPGKVITLTEMGKYSGSYYVTATRHIFQERVYTTEFSVRGLRGGDLLSVLAPKPRLQPGQTLLVGIVSNNVDPDKLGRVKVKFPTLTEEHESNWARVVAIGAGVSRGFDNLPEINDEVLVGFEHGDIHRPYVIGGVWNKNDPTPTSVDDSVADGKVRLRTIQTRFGQTLQFVEEDKGAVKNGIYIKSKDASADCHSVSINNTDKFIEIKTKDQHTITLQDSNQGKQHIEIKTSGGHIVKLDDQHQKIEIISAGGHSITMNDQTKKVEVVSTGDITAKSGTSGTTNNIEMNGSQINLTGAQSITLDAASTITLKVGGTKLTLSASSAKLEAPIVTVEATGIAKLAGNMTNVEGNAMTKIQGGLVKIN
jgi:uncharacterized protein involved in type VI secretion and phage assembly